MNDLFANKRHQAYARCARQEKRTEVIQNKFNHWSNNAKAELDRKIHEAYVKQNEELGATLE